MVDDAQLEALLRQLAVVTRAGAYGPSLLSTLLPTVPAPLRTPLRRALGQGVPLSEALFEASLLTPAERAVLVAGERTGRVPELLEALASAIAQRRESRRRTLLALAYPALLVSLGGFLLTAPLAVTRGVGGWLALAVWPAALVAAAAALVFVVVPRLSPASPLRALPWRLALSVPLLGKGLERGALASLCEVLSQLIEAGLPYTLALPTALDASGHPRLAHQGARVTAKIDDGATLADALGELLPARLTRPLAAAEMAGTVPQLLRSCARDEREAYRRWVLGVVAALGGLAFLVVAIGIAASIVVGAQGYLEQIDAVADPD